MSRVVASTLAGETQSFSTASGISEWMSLMISEAKRGRFDLRDCEDHLKRAPTFSSKIDDKRVAIDLTIMRQSMARRRLHVRWCPTQLMVADSLTTNQADPADLLRALLANGVYQLSNEAEVLAQKKAQRDRRARRQQSGEAKEPKPSPAVFRRVYIDHQATSYHPPRR